MTTSDRTISVSCWDFQAEDLYRRKGKCKGKHGQFRKWSFKMAFRVLCWKINIVGYEFWDILGVKEHEWAREKMNLQHWSIYWLNRWWPENSKTWLDHHSSKITSANRQHQIAVWHSEYHAQWDRPSNFKEKTLHYNWCFTKDLLVTVRKKDVWHISSTLPLAPSREHSYESSKMLNTCVGLCTRETPVEPTVTLLRGDLCNLWLSTYLGQCQKLWLKPIWDCKLRQTFWAYEIRKGSKDVGYTNWNCIAWPLSLAIRNHVPVPEWYRT